MSAESPESEPCGCCLTASKDKTGIPILPRLFSRPSLALSGIGVPFGVVLVLSTRLCLLPERGVIFAVRNEATGGVDTSSLCWPGVVAIVAVWFCVRRPRGVTTGGPLAATLGVKGGRVAALAAAALSCGWRGRSPGGILGSRAALVVVERVAVSDSTLWLLLGRGRSGGRSEGAVTRFRGGGFVLGLLVAVALVRGLETVEDARGGRLDVVLEVGADAGVSRARIFWVALSWRARGSWLTVLVGEVPRATTSD